MLTIVPCKTQPWLSSNSLTLINMKDWHVCKSLGERLEWALERASVSRAALADACGTSTVSVGKWVNDNTKNMRMANLFTVARLCMANAEWLGTGEGSPTIGIPSIYQDIAGPDLQIARELTKLDDKKLRATIKELIAAKQNMAQKEIQAKGKKAV